MCVCVILYLLLPLFGMCSKKPVTSLSSWPRVHSVLRHLFDLSKIGYNESWGATQNVTVTKPQPRMSLL